MIRALPLLLALAPALAAAGPFDVQPIPLVLDATRRSAALVVRNTGAAPASLQVEAARWTQGEDGAERYDPAPELVIFPELLRLAAGEERVVRVGLDAAPHGADGERAYRVYLQELPVDEPGQPRVKMTFRLGVPLFVKPDREAPRRHLARIWLDGGLVHVRLENPGNVHARVRRLRIDGKDAAGRTRFERDARGWYVLAGAAAVYSLRLDEADCREARVLSVAADLSDGTSLPPATLELPPTGCAAAPAAPAP
ncbi:MAG: fimbria/pilus periplasmic chaperone [Anaeromyxobacteraceae bacterium]